MNTNPESVIVSETSTAEGKLIVTVAAPDAPEATEILPTADDKISALLLPEKGLLAALLDNASSSCAHIIAKGKGVMHVARIGQGEAVPAGLVFSKTQINDVVKFAEQIAGFSVGQVVIINTYGKPTFLLTKLGIDESNVTVEGKTSTRTRNANANPVNALISAATTALKNHHGLNLSLDLSSNKGTVKIPEIDGMSFTLSVSGNIDFPLSAVIDGNKLKAITVGHYRLSSKNADGFDESSLTDALFRCFNIAVQA